MTSDPLRLVIHDYGGYPFTAQLARCLARRGHRVLYLYGGREPRAAMTMRPDDAGSLTIESLDLGEPRIIRTGPGRLLQERRYGRLLASRITHGRPDVVVSADTPLDAQVQALSAAKAVGAAFVPWVQDLYSVAVRRILGRRLPVLGHVIGAHFARMERRILRNSEAVIVIAEDFRSTTQEWGVSDERTYVIENWAPLDEIEPLEKRNAWAKRHALADSFVFLYAGTLGRKHDPTLLARLAEALPEARVVVASEGAGNERLNEMRKSRPNLRMLPLQRAEEVPEMLATADVLVAILEEDAAEFSVPSKVLTYLAAARPTLAAIPRSNLAARIIESADAGIVVDASDLDGFLAAARWLFEDGHRRMSASRSARTYAVREFDIETKADQFLAVMKRASREVHRRPTERIEPRVP